MGGIIDKTYKIIPYLLNQNFLIYQKLFNTTISGINTIPYYYKLKYINLRFV